MAVLAFLLGLVGAGPVGPAAAESSGLSRFRLVAIEALAPGVEHQMLHRDEPAQVVHVVRMATGMAGRLLPVLANDVLTGPAAGVEPASAMCIRVQCVAAVNGDFFDASGQPIGAVVAGGELLATPRIRHISFNVDGLGRPAMQAGLDWSVVLTPRDGVPLPVTAVNRPLSGEGITLYSRRWGPATGTDEATTEVALQLPPTLHSFLPSGLSAVTVGPAQTGGNLPIPAGHVVLSGRGAGAEALRALSEQEGVVGLLSVSVGSVMSAIGGSPQLLQGGHIDYPADRPDSFTQDRQPRTVVGITASGEVLLVTADGRGASAGLTLLEAARLLAGLGAVDAMNLDGGGSTTFVTGGSVRNVPSGGSQREVATALAVVAAAPMDLLAALLAQVTDAVATPLQPAA